MDRLLVLMAMLYFHIMDDFRHQGILAQMKQKSWWQENAPDNMYKHDYIVALLEHAFSWTVAIHIPLFVYGYLNDSFVSPSTFLITFVFTWLWHAFIDNEKANRDSINLVFDQICHIIQIIVTLSVYKPMFA